MDVDSDKFRLRTQLINHVHQVRSVASHGSDLIVSAESDSICHAWRAGAESGEFRETAPLFGGEPIHGDAKLLMCLEAVRDAEGTFVSGANDNLCRIWTVGADIETISVLAGHSGSVNSVCQTNKGYFVTGSFDTTAKVWKNEKCVATLEGHKYGVEVCCATTGEIITGSYKDILLWKNGSIVKTIRNAHEHVIRRIIRHPLGFATCANDGYVKIWSNLGELLSVIEAHPIRGDTPAFVYSVAVLPEGRLVSVGEDRKAKVWNPDGTLFQSIPHPAPVRCVCVLTNGDIVTGADSAVRVFSADSARQVDEKMQAEYEMICRAQATDGEGGSVKQLDESQYPGPESLKGPGAQNGEMKIVNMPEGLTVFQWDEPGDKWNKVGLAMGEALTDADTSTISSGSRRKTTLDGVEYDHVTHIYVTEDRHESLGFNVDDDPQEVAIAFCDRHAVDRSSVSEILSHLQPLADPIARSQRLKREAAERRREFRQIPSWKRYSFELYTTVNALAMKNKILEFNTELIAANHFAAVSSDSIDMNFLENLLATVAKPANFHVGSFALPLKKMALRLMSWPGDKMLPVLDMLRVLMCHAGACAELGSDSEFRTRLAALQKSADGAADEATEKRWMLTSRLLGNWVAKRNQSDAEQCGKECPRDVLDFLTEMVQNVRGASRSPSKAVHSSLVMFLHNVMFWFCKFNFESSDIYDIAADCLIEVLKEERSDKVTFYAMLTIGTMAVTSGNVCDSIRLRYASDLAPRLEKCSNSGNSALKEVSADLMKLFRQKE
eukprot:1004226_1